MMAVGCRNDPNIALLERELRQQEDKIYEAEDLAEDCKLELESCRRENAALKKRLEEAKAGSGYLDGLAPPPGVTGPTLPSGEKKLGSPPVVLPAETEPSQEAPDTLEFPPPPEQNEPTPPDNLQDPASGEAAAHVETDNSKVARITLNRSLTGGNNADGQRGDEGITLLVEPRDAAGRLVLAAAPISVVMLDGALSGEAARVARWDFTAEETRAMYRKTPLAEGFYLEMFWPATAPTHENLHLFVRYTTADGRKLEADRPIEVALSRSQPAAWTSTNSASLQGPAFQASPSTPWHGVSTTETQLPSPQPVRTAARPDEPSIATGHPSTPQRPVWSPDRQ